MNELPAAETVSVFAYLLMRTDLPSLGHGKGNAQAMHAGNHMTHELCVKPLLAGTTPDPRVVAWHSEGGGFGTAIALGSRGQVTLTTLSSTVNAAHMLDFQAALIEDGSYPYDVDAEIFRLIDPRHHTRDPIPTAAGYRCFRREVTGAWIFGNKTELEVLLARFDLAPHFKDYN